MDKDCYSLEIYACNVDNCLERDVKKDFEEHLQGCGECQKKIAQFIKDKANAGKYDFKRLPDKIKDKLNKYLNFDLLI